MEEVILENLLKRWLRCPLKGERFVACSFLGLSTLDLSSKTLLINDQWSPILDLWSLIRDPALTGNPLPWNIFLSESYHRELCYLRYWPLCWQAVNLQMNRTVKCQRAFFRIVGLAGKRIFSPLPLPSLPFFSFCLLLLQFSRIDMIDLRGKACYAGNIIRHQSFYFPDQLFSKTRNQNFSIQRTANKSVFYPVKKIVYTVTS